MIIAAARITGTDTVLEFNPEAPWSSIYFHREGKHSSYLFLGKFSIIHTSGYACPCFGRMLATLVVAAGVITTSAVAAATAVQVLDLIATTGLGPH